MFLERAASSSHVLLRDSQWALKLSVLYPQPDGRGVVSKTRLLKSKRGARAKSDVTTDEAQKLFNEYQVTRLRVKPKALAGTDLCRLFALPPAALATGTGSGHQFLALRAAGVDLMRLARTLNARRYPLGAVCAVGIDMVRRFGRVTWGGPACSAVARAVGGLTTDEPLQPRTVVCGFVGGCV